MTERLKWDQPRLPLIFTYLNPAISPEYLKREVIDEGFRNRFLDELGITGEVPLDSLPFSELILLIPVMESALNLQKASERQTDIADWVRAEEFFGHFTDPEAVDPLIKLLDNKIAFPANFIDPNNKPLSERFFRESRTCLGEEINIPGGQQDISGHPVCKMFSYEVQVTEREFLAYRPVVRGAESALISIAFKHPNLPEKIGKALEPLSRQQTIIVSTESGEIPRTRKPIGTYKAETY